MATSRGTDTKEWTIVTISQYLGTAGPRATRKQVRPQKKLPARIHASIPNAYPARRRQEDATKGCRGCRRASKKLNKRKCRSVHGPARGVIALLQQQEHSAAASREPARSLALPTASTVQR